MAMPAILAMHALSYLRLVAANPRAPKPTRRFIRIPIRLAGGKSKSSISPRISTKSKSIYHQRSTVNDACSPYNRYPQQHISTVCCRQQTGHRILFNLFHQTAQPCVNRSTNGGYPPRFSPQRLPNSIR